MITWGRQLELSKIKNTRWNRTVKRKEINIAVIDDEIFPLLENLSAHGYDIVKFDDVTDIRVLAEYDIIACDIMGVGTSFGSRHGGGHLIKEIKIQYPDKFLIFFSGGTFGPTFKKFSDYADTSIKKDADTDDWVDLLDFGIEEIIDPYNRWIRARRVLIDREISVHTLAKLEQAYIKSVLKGKPAILASRANNIVEHKEQLDIKNTIEGLTIFLVKLIKAGGGIK